MTRPCRSRCSSTWRVCGLPGLAGGVEDGAQPVGGGLVGADQAEVPAVGGVRHDLFAAGRRGPGWARAGWRPACRRGRRSGPGSGMGRSRTSRPPLACGLAPRRWSPSGTQARTSATGRPSASKSSSGRYERSQCLQLPQVLRVFAHRGQRDLVGAPGALDRARRRPRRVRSSPSGCAARSSASGRARSTPSSRAVRCISGDAVQGAVHGVAAIARWTVVRVVAGDVDRVVAVAAQQVVEFGLRHAGQHGRVGDLVAVEVQDRQDGAVVDRVEELVGVPGRRPAARSRPRRRRSRRRPAGPGCRRRRRRRATSE